MHMRERESKNLNKIAISKCFFFFFFSSSWISRYHDAMITRQRETEKIFNFTRYSSVNLVWTYFFFFFEKRKRRFNFVDSFDEARNEDWKYHDSKNLL